MPAADRNCTQKLDGKINPIEFRWEGGEKPHRLASTLRYHRETPTAKTA
jgi:hypothetical protein